MIRVMLNIAYPAAFSVGGPPAVLRGAAVAVLVVGVVLWAWSVVLIVTRARLRIPSTACGWSSRSAHRDCRPSCFPSESPAGCLRRYS